jgi:hypothetical protein
LAVCRTARAKSGFQRFHASAIASSAVGAVDSTNAAASSFSGSWMTVMFRDVPAAGDAKSRARWQLELRVFGELPERQCCRLLDRAWRRRLCRRRRRRQREHE